MIDLNARENSLCPSVFSVDGSKNQPQRARRARKWAIAGVISVLTLLTIASVSAQQGATTHTIVIKAMRYQPDQLEVRAGDTVEWKNEDIVAHTVTARDKSFDSGKIAPGSSWKLTVKKASTIDYGCIPHPNMKGRLVVK
jgi:plastocyanin